MFEGAIGGVMLASTHGWPAMAAASAGLVLLVLLGLLLAVYSGPGSWVVLGGTAFYVWWAGQPSGRWLVLGAMGVLALMGEILEFVAASRGVSSRGGSRRAAWGALAGGLIGAFTLTFIPVPVISTIIGAVLGCFAGAFLLQLTVAGSTGHSASVGLAAAWGRLLGTVLKLLIVLLLSCAAGYLIIANLLGQRVAAG